MPKECAARDLQVGDYYRIRNSSAIFRCEVVPVDHLEWGEGIDITASDSYALEYGETVMPLEVSSNNFDSKGGAETFVDHITNEGFIVVRIIHTPPIKWCVYHVSLKN